MTPSRPHAVLSANGKTVIITAGHSGIGYSIATNFALADASNVIILGRRVDVLESTRKDLAAAATASGMSTNFHAFATSINDEERVYALFQQIRREIAEPDILVTSAADFADPAQMLQTPLQRVRASLETNVLGNLNLVHEFLDLASPPAPTSSTNAPTTTTTMKKSKIILDVSSAAIHAFVPKNGAYAASKIAFSNIMATAQIETAFSSSDVDLRIHSFHSGAVLTEAVRAHGWTENSGIDWDDAQLPGQFAVWLVSPEAEFLKGRFFWANWDVDELLQRREEIVKEDLLKIGVVGRAEWEKGGLKS